MKLTACAIVAAFTVALAPLTWADNLYHHDHDHGSVRVTRPWSRRCEPPHDALPTSTSLPAPRARVPPRADATL
ncbi:MAG TPA: hypothetical protein VI653_00315 [Steroidobacteraceae bacterium]